MITMLTFIGENLNSECKVMEGTGFHLTFKNNKFYTNSIEKVMYALMLNSHSNNIIDRIMALETMNAINEFGIEKE